ncbi:carbohydrate ABC transporter permease [Jiangella asiatica]|uniref:Carbohydrate ABC transporter permease n=1 Tax=Jiangella asiatica TaxID=2530372 RepID=A0A4R5CQG1_9ACTN|nr:carbohydrate ABC transporter permease [Jiangella asiatica]
MGLRWSVAATAVTLIYLIPVYWMLATSLKPLDQIFASPPRLVPIPATVASYTEVVFADPDVVRGLLNSAIIAVGTTVLTLLVAVPAAFALARLRIRFVAPVLMLFLVVQMIPSINLALPMFVIFNRAGLVDSFAGLIIANGALAVPLAVVILRPYFLTVPGEVLDAARVDGCTTFGAFLRIATPMSVPGLVTVAVITFLQAWGEFVFGLALATDEAMQPISVVLAGLNNAFGTRWNDVMAVSVVVALPVVLAFVFLQRFIVAGLTEGATKS